MEMSARVENLAIPHAHSRLSGVVTVSLGVVRRYPRREGKEAGFLKAAESQLYRSKQEGRNRVSVTEWPS